LRSFRSQSKVTSLNFYLKNHSIEERGKKNV